MSSSQIITNLQTASQIVQNSKLKVKALNDTIENTELLQTNVKQCMKEMLDLLHDLLMDYTKYRFQEYIECMQTVKSIWLTTENKVVHVQDTMENGSYSQRNRLQTIVDDDEKAIKNLLEASEDENPERNMHMSDIVKFLLANCKTKPFIQQLYALINGMEINIYQAPSVLLLSSTYCIQQKPEIYSMMMKEEQKIRYKEYGLCILSHGATYVEGIEYDLIKQIKGIQIDKNPEEFEDVIDGKITMDKLNWTKYIEEMHRNSNEFVDMFEALFDVQIKDIIEGLMLQSIKKENDSVLCWKLSIDEKESYKYNMNYIIGPCLIGRMARKYFPNSLNAKYLKCYEMITNGYLRDIYNEMDSKQIIPQSIIDLIEMFFKTTLDEYPFGCMFLCNVD